MCRDQQDPLFKVSSYPKKPPWRMKRINRLTTFSTDSGISVKNDSVDANACKPCPLSAPYHGSLGKNGMGTRRENGRSIKVLLMCRVLCEMMRTLIFGFSVFLLPCNYALMFPHCPIKDEALFVNVRFLNGDGK
jgi:hypothetical protein